MTITNAKEISRYVDHTLLRPDAGDADLLRACAEAREHEFFGVCVNSMHIPLVAQELRGSRIATVAVIGFPLGATATAAKCFETEWALKSGATEVDMVIDLGGMKEGNYKRVESDIAAVASICKQHVLKVILETIFLSDEEKRVACKITRDAGAHFVKTCTGFGGGSATISDIALMREAVGPNFGVKASGGIKTTAAAVALIDAGATRLGTSSGVALVQGQAVGQGY